MKSLLIKDTTREERIKIIMQGLSVCGSECDFCNGCDNLGGGRVETMYQDYIDGKRELKDINMSFQRGYISGVDLPSTESCGKN